MYAKRYDGKRDQTDAGRDRAAESRLRHQAVGRTPRRQSGGLIKLFRNKSIYRTPEAYIDNLRTINAMRMLRTQHNYSIAAIAEASGFNHVRTLQRRLMDVTGMTPADYRALFTRDM
jgi:transcriptional regulator GlxA family with amidase domain